MWLSKKYVVLLLLRSLFPEYFATFFLICYYCLKTKGEFVFTALWGWDRSARSVGGPEGRRVLEPHPLARVALCGPSGPYAFLPFGCKGSFNVA